MASYVSTFTGNGSEVHFTAGFPVLRLADLAVVVNGAWLTLGVDYSVSGSTSGPLATLAVAPANGAVVTLRSAVGYTPTDPAAPYAVVPTLNSTDEALWRAMRDGDQAIIDSGLEPTNVGIAPVVATGSTAARTVSDHLGDSINVKSFGAIGNGTADDSTAFQDAIDYASSIGGGTVVVPQGKYRIVTPLNLWDHVSLVGKAVDFYNRDLGTTLSFQPASPGSVLITTAHIDGYVYTSNYIACRVADFTITGDGVNAATAIKFARAEFRAERVSISGFTGAGIVLDFVLSSALESVQVKGGTYGIYFEPTTVSTSTRITSCILSGQTTAGISISAALGVVIDGETVFQGMTCDAIRISDTTAGTTSKVEVYEPYVEDVGGRFIAAGIGTELTESVVVYGGTIQPGAYMQNTEDLIYLDRVGIAHVMIPTLYGVTRSSFIRTTTNTGPIVAYWPRNNLLVSGTARANSTAYSAGQRLSVACSDGVTRIFVVTTGGTTAGSLPAGYDASSRTAYGMADGTCVVRSLHQLVIYNPTKATVMNSRGLGATSSAIELTRDQETVWTLQSGFAAQPSDVYLLRDGASSPAFYADPTTDRVGTGAFEVSTHQQFKAKGGIESDQTVDTDAPILTLRGSGAESNTNFNVTDWTTGATIAGFVRVRINSTDRWMPYYTAPTS